MNTAIYINEAYAIRAAQYVQETLRNNRKCVVVSDKQGHSIMIMDTDGSNTWVTQELLGTIINSKPAKADPWAEYPYFDEAPVNKVE